MSSPELLRIKARLHANDIEGACDLAREAYIEGIVDPLILNLVAHRLETRGEMEEALDLLHQALKLNPTDAALYANIGHCLLKLARPAHALEAFNRALKLDVRLVRAHHGAGLALTALGDAAAGQGAQARAHQLDPRDPAPIASLAMAAYLRKDYPAAEALADEALAKAPGETSALIVKGSLYWERGDAKACAELLGPVLQSNAIPPLHRSALERQYADALDRLGRYDEAFLAYENANALLRRVYEDRFDAPDLVSTAQVCERLADFFSDYRDTPSEHPADFAKNGSREHVFLMGFPRSGTTLLEQVLAGNPDIEALEEMPTLDDAISEYFIKRSDVSSLMSAPENELDVWREIYWAKIKSFGVEVQGKVFIDKQPSMTIHIPLIRRLFPNAKILFCIRDPRDVVFGCFRRTFRMSSLVFEYTRLETLTRLYGLTMRLGEIYLDRLQLPVHRHKHEYLLSNFDDEVAALCAFLNVEFNDGMRDVVGTTVRRDVRTPSARQIRVGLNVSGVGYWRKYRRHIESQLPALEPWALKFGYPSAWPDDAAGS